MKQMECLSLLIQMERTTMSGSIQTQEFPSGLKWGSFYPAMKHLWKNFNKIGNCLIMWEATQSSQRNSPRKARSQSNTFRSSLKFIWLLGDVCHSTVEIHSPPLSERVKNWTRFWLRFKVPELVQDVVKWQGQWLNRLFSIKNKQQLEVICNNIHS